jgi:hypothetical protein
MIIPNYFGDFSLAAMAKPDVGIELGHITATSTNAGKAIYDEGEVLVVGYEEEVTIEFIFAKDKEFYTDTAPNTITSPTPINVWLAGASTNANYPLRKFMTNWPANADLNKYRLAIEALKEYFLYERNLYLISSKQNDRLARTNVYDMNTVFEQEKDDVLNYIPNGLKTLEFEVEDAPGVHHLKCKWRFKTVRHIDNKTEKIARDLFDRNKPIIDGYDSEGNPIYRFVGANAPIISSEVRLTIDEDGDVVILVSGSMYSSRQLNVSDGILRDGREYLIVEVERGLFGQVEYQLNDQYEYGSFKGGTIVNGFERHIEYNIDKTGLMAKFTLKYKTIKSNNALPLGIRDIEFNQTIKSDLLGKDPMNGSGFQTWRQSFFCKIKLPPRMSATYAWFIMHALLLQQLRKSTFIFSAKEVKDGIGKVESANTLCRALPLSIKIMHRHYNREVTFNMEYLLISPINMILNTSCIFNRINIDYDNDKKKADKYRPITLSEQWQKWQKADEPSNFFRPFGNLPAALIPFEYHPYPHSDKSGLNITATTHFDRYNSSGQYYTTDRRQITSFITTQIDPTDFDFEYSHNYSWNLPGFVGWTESKLSPVDGDGAAIAPPTGVPNTASQLKSGLEQNGLALSSLNNYNRGPKPAVLPSYINGIPDPAYTWVMHNQSYEVIEQNQTQTIEAILPLTEKDYTNPTLASVYGIEKLEDGSYSTPSTLTDPQVAEVRKSRVLTNSNMIGRTVGNDTINFTELPPLEDEPVTTSINSRKTIASKAPRYFLKVRGQAIRAFYKIPTPEVIMIAGKPAIRHGNARVQHTLLNPGSDIPIYMAMWEQTYTIDGSVITDDLLSSIESSGASILYA